MRPIPAVTSGIQTVAVLIVESSDNETSGAKS